ncbi:unnamed protein product [Diamesa serratosioi]
MSRSLTKEMRSATREIHNISDGLVNAKLAIALNNDAIYADGLLIFYEIFKFLEENVPETILPREYYKTEDFEMDLNFFKGRDWQKTYKPRDSVQQYLKYLKELDQTLLIAYVYHLYMGLLSGGSIISKKRELTKKLRRSFLKDKDNDDRTFFEEVEDGCHVTTFINQSIPLLKNNMRRNIDRFTEHFSDELRHKLIQESKMVFEHNNEIIKTVEGVNVQNLKIIGYFLVTFLCVYLLIKMF